MRVFVLNVLLSGLVALMSPKARALELSPQDVVDLALKQSLQVKQTAQDAAKAEAEAETLRGPYDLKFLLTPMYTYTEAQNLAGTANPVDRSFTVFSSLTKAISTGTTLGLEFNRVEQQSTLSAFSSSLRRDRAASSSILLSIRQAVWRNIFGQADRAVLAAADGRTVIAKLQREESLEDVILQSLSLYWNAYVGEVQLREIDAARLKYDELVKAVRRKAGFNLSSPGELPRLEAEYAAADSRVKLSSQTYLASLDTLRTALQLDPSETIRFQASPQEVKDLPLVPKLAAVDVTKLRPIRIAKIQRENAERDRTAAYSQSRPKLDLIAKAGATGTDETADLAFSKMTSATGPTYVIGLELEWPFDSSDFRGKRAVAEAGYQTSMLKLKLAQDGLRDTLLANERSVVANREAAVASIEIVGRRTQVVKELESSYRQGRTPLVELIRAFNDLFTAQQDRARAVGNYMIALNQWAAARDELVQTGISQ